MGWARTSHLFGVQDADGSIAQWVSRFGPGGYEFVLAGFTVDEAVNMRAAGTLPGLEELRVMAALYQAPAPK